VDKWVWAHFTKEEMQCRCGCEGLPKDEFMSKLEGLRMQLGFPLRITSGYRCPAYNAVISSSGDDGPHTRGLAADIAIYGESAFRLLVKAVGIFTGIGINQKGEIAQRYIHVDSVKVGDLLIPRPRVWNY
jgi:uncharacterized protein YcbK (DUF882 family)